MADNISEEQLPQLFQGVADIFAEKKDELCFMDAHMGDGDLGLTMQKGCGALPELLVSCSESGDIGKTLVKAGMKVACLAPSTMGTLMASGLIEGGKMLIGEAELGPEELAVFLEGFSRGIQKRGKCEPGDRTILDAVHPAAKGAKAAADAGGSLKDVMEEAAAGAEEGVEATKNMLPKFGKAAVFASKAQGVPDQGAVAGMYLMKGLLRFWEE